MAALVPPPGLGCNDCLAHMGKVKLVGENKFLQTSCRPSHASFGTAPGGEVEEARIAQAGNAHPTVFASEGHKQDKSSGSRLSVPGETGAPNLTLVGI